MQSGTDYHGSGISFHFKDKSNTGTASYSKKIRPIETPCIRTLYAKVKDKTERDTLAKHFLLNQFINLLEKIYEGFVRLCHNTKTAYLSF